MYRIGSAEFIEAAQFTEAIQALRAEESLRELQALLVRNPEAGALLPRTGGCPKVRMALPGRGKTGGARVIYFLPASGQVIFLLSFTPRTFMAHCPTNKKTNCAPEGTMNRKKKSKGADAVEIEFDADRLVREFDQLATDYRDGSYRHKYRTRTVTAKPVAALDAQRILHLRENVYRMSRGAFAAVLNVPVDTLRKWESGERNPSGAARRLLDLLMSKPEVAQDFVSIASNCSASARCGPVEARS